jgi:hypothetical protein
MKLQLEVNQRFAKAKDSIEVGNGQTLLITPPLDEDYWAFRVKLKGKQAIVAFPKFGTIGCGFAKEKDWNTNLPISCGAEEIYEHIKHNKQNSTITREQCIEAIQLIQSVAIPMLSAERRVG